MLSLCLKKGSNKAFSHSGWVGWPNSTPPPHLEEKMLAPSDALDTWRNWNCVTAIHLFLRLQFRFAMYAFVPGEAATVNPPIRDDSVTVINSAEDNDDDDDASLGPNPTGNYGDDD